MAITIFASEEYGTKLRHTEETNALTIPQLEALYGEVLYLMMYDLYDRQKEDSVSLEEILKILNGKVYEIMSNRG
jgi:hypothetical protein